MSTATNLKPRPAGYKTKRTTIRSSVYFKAKKQENGIRDFSRTVVHHFVFCENTEQIFRRKGYVDGIQGSDVFKANENTSGEAV
jgi:hypothetical protein